jgi:hypothetical protein
MQRGDDPIDLGVTVERRPIPGSWKVAPVGEQAAGAAEPVDRPAGVIAGKAAEPAAAAQCAPCALRRIPQRLLKPRAERPPIDAVGLRLGQHDEQRIDARLHGALAQQLGAEPVNSIDVRFLERFEREVQSVANLASRRVGALLFQLFAKPQLELARRLFSEGDGDDLDHGGAPGREDPKDAVHQLGGLAGACCRLDDQRVVEILGDGAAGIVIVLHR